jgi:hypothetical protein
MKIITICFLCFFYSVELFSQKGKIYLNVAYIKGDAKIKESWNTLPGLTSYKSLNGYTYGVGFEFDRYRLLNPSIDLNIKKFGIETLNLSPSFKFYQEFKYANISISNRMSIYKRLNFSLGLDIIHLLDFNAVTSNNIGKVKSSNYFGFGYNSDYVTFNETTAGLNIGISYNYKNNNIYLKRNIGFVPLAYLKKNMSFQLYTSNVELGINVPIKTIRIGKKSDAS